ncbi:MAG: S26 family signal peptidase [Thiobacillus sp.]|jgi:conjugative transfer signal peptidase TraF|uniref:S26 family signal peptidase n=1 Tax=Thiobacillus sedimenti TaxID=3110231 RepID=A0ABZ1CFR2_9PROT|nr:MULTISPECIES: S26 family signal peptidase [unclassified Thiobacillus]MBN8762102.1 S26 family signal peptidase [Thiobacillus sp.]OJY54851.1 MAG: S26 family signal peptidase [Thiobacillus sp. 0-1251]QLQ01630.1 MAG: S26 family signal peptidase [Thiobacillus sp.]TXH74736.1 MAG: S26 family signal peptidase [Thiobacillus sp.]WRS38219.1 S26 family signal peptidase [Thiobacillus sp. SCUT-2]
MNTRVHRWAVVLFTVLGIAALAWPSDHAPVARLVYNPSDSVPRGWYRISPPDSLHVDSIVLARLPADAAALAAQRGYLPERIPLLKRIGAMSPQQVCIEKHIVRIDDVAVAGVHSVDGRGRPLSAWQQCRPLRDGELFLLSATNPASFDSRYFGPIAVSAVIGSAQPLWTWDTP